MLACPWSVGAGVWMPRNHTQRSLLAVHMHNVKIGGHTGSMQKRLKRQVHRSYGGNKIYTPFLTRSTSRHLIAQGFGISARAPHAHKRHATRLMLNSSAEGAGRSEPAKEMDIFASNSNPEGAVTSPPSSISIKREPDEQTAVTKRVRFVPVAPLDEGDVTHLCGINGCRSPLEPHPTPHAPRPTPHGRPHRTANGPPPAAHPSPTVRRAHTATLHTRPRLNLSPSRHPRPALPRARLRCPLSWNHAGICSVQTFPGRTRRVRDEAKPPVELPS